MAQETWMAVQDREGLQLSPAFAVPAGKARAVVTLESVGYTNEAQDVSLRVQASFNNRDTYEAYGGATFRGGDPGRRGRTVTVNLHPANYPTHLRVETYVAGVVNCGVNVEFFDPEPAEPAAA